MVNLSVPRAPGAAPSDVPGLLRALLADDPGRPRLTWYGPDGERVELSAKVLDNWVAKTANLLVDELDAGPGARVAIALPPHWRTVAWLLATWSTGACVVAVPVPDGDLTADGVRAAVPDDVDVLVAGDPAVLSAAPARARTVAVALPALATSYGPDLPAGALDAALEVRSYGDVFVPFVRPTPDDDAFAPSPARAPRAGPGGRAGGVPGGRAAGVTLTHGGLIPAATRAADAAGLPPRVRLLTGAGADGAVTDLLAPLARLGSVVLHHDLPGTTPEALAHLRTQEGVTSLHP